jgi:rhodanese-related sulfurtransferase
MITNVKEMIESANASVPRINAAQAKELIAKGALIVDVRDAQEIAQSGKIAGAISVSRGMLEFRADPASPYHDKNFDIERTLILYCASGGRSALGASTLKDMGYARVYNLGAFKDWVESGGAVEHPAESATRSIRKPTCLNTVLAAFAAIALLVAANSAWASGPIVPPGHKSQHAPKPPRDDKHKHHGRHHRWHTHFLETSLRETGWICVKAYRDRHGFWRCTAWAMQ